MTYPDEYCLLLKKETLRLFLRMETDITDMQSNPKRLY